MEKPDCTLCFDFDFGLFQASPLCVPSGGRVYQTTFSEWRGDTNRFSIRASLTWFKTQGRLGCVLCSLLAESVAALSFGDDDWERGYYDLFTPSFLVVHGSRRVLLYVDVIRPASVQQYRIHAVPSERAGSSNPDRLVVLALTYCGRTPQSPFGARRWVFSIL